MSWLSDRLPALSGPVIVAAAIAGSAWFAARFVTHLAEAEAFDERRHDRAATAPALAPAPTPAAAMAFDPPRGTALVERNMFCSSCPPPGPGEGGAVPPGSGSHAVPRLIATQVGGRESWATLDDPVSGVAGLFMLGAALPGGGVIEAIEPGAMIVRFSDKTTQRVVLATGEAVVAARAPVVAAAADLPWSDRVRAVGDDRWEVDRTMIRDLVSAGAGGGGAGVKGVRLAPVGKDGALTGVRVALARDGSLAKALGLQTGDVIESIDGRAIDSAATLMQVYGRLDDLRRVDLGIKRKGAARTLTYDLP